MVGAEDYGRVVMSKGRGTWEYICERMYIQQVLHS